MSCKQSYKTIKSVQKRFKKNRVGRDAFVNFFTNYFVELKILTPEQLKSTLSRDNPLVHENVKALLHEVYDNIKTKTSCSKSTSKKLKKLTKEVAKQLTKVFELPDDPVTVNKVSEKITKEYIPRQVDVTTRVGIKEFVEDIVKPDTLQVKDFDLEPDSWQNYTKAITKYLVNAITLLLCDNVRDRPDVLNAVRSKVTNMIHKFSTGTDNSEELVEYLNTVKQSCKKKRTDSELHDLLHFINRSFPGKLDSHQIAYIIKNGDPTAQYNKWLSLLENYVTTVDNASNARNFIANIKEAWELVQKNLKSEESSKDFSNLVNNTDEFSINVPEYLRKLATTLDQVKQRLTNRFDNECKKSTGTFGFLWNAKSAVVNSMTGLNCNIVHNDVLQLEKLSKSVRDWYDDHKEEVLKDVTSENQKKLEEAMGKLLGTTVFTHVYGAVNTKDEYKHLRPFFNNSNDFKRVLGI